MIAGAKGKAAACRSDRDGMEATHFAIGLRLKSAWREFVIYG